MAVVLLDDRWWIGWIVGFGSVFAVFASRKLVPMIMEKVKGGRNDASCEEDKLDNAL